VLTLEVNNKKNETIVLNNIIKPKNHQFLWKDLIQYHDKCHVDLYRFEDLRKRFESKYINTADNYHRDIVSKKINNIQLNNNEYFIGVYYENIKIIGDRLQIKDENYNIDIIFYTNYGNIIEFCFHYTIVPGGGRSPIILDIKFYNNNKKLNAKLINHINLIVARSRVEQTVINILGKELNDIIKNLQIVI
jgi:superfamily II DNA or RNA helicase